MCIDSTVISSGEHSSVTIDREHLLSHKNSKRKTQPDTVVPADGFSLVLDDQSPQTPSTIQRHSLKDDKNNVFLCVETSLASQ